MTCIGSAISTWILDSLRAMRRLLSLLANFQEYRLSRQARSDFPIDRLLMGAEAHTAEEIKICRLVVEAQGFTLPDQEFLVKAQASGGELVVQASTIVTFAF